MEMSFLKTLCNSLSQICTLSSRGGVKSELEQRYCLEVDEMSKLLEPVFDEIASVITLDEQLNKFLEELDGFINEARECLESWQQMTSKVYFVLQIEQVMKKIQTSVIEVCRLLSSLFHSYEVKSGSEYVEQCAQKIQARCYEDTSNVIKEAIRDHLKNDISRPELLLKIADSLALSTNEELLMEVAALDKMKTKTAHGENHGEMEYIDNMIALITHMHDCYVRENQVHSINNVQIPTDFCCPLSLDLMSDPVIVSSGQTYERAFIRKWLDQGFTVCPKTRQTLGTTLIPNYTVKALIANWCEENNVKLPDPAKSLNLKQPTSFIAHADHGADTSSTPCLDHSKRATSPRSPESNRFGRDPNKNLVISNGSHEDTHLNDKPSSSNHPHSQFVNGFATNIGRSSFDSSKGTEGSGLEMKHTDSKGQTSHQSTEDHSHAGDELFLGRNQSSSTSTGISGTDYLQGAGDGSTASQASSNLTHYSGDASGEVTQEVPAPSAPLREPEFPPRIIESRSRSQTIWRRTSERFSPRTMSSPSLVTRPDLSGVETQVCKLLEELKNDSVDVQRAATAELRLLAKHNMENRIVIANCGAITQLVSLLLSTDIKTQENAVTALLNLSINDNNKVAIANADSIVPLRHVLTTGNSEAKENSAATLFSLSKFEENKVKIGRSGAIGPLVELLGNGTPRGKKDAATALYNLSLLHENKLRIVQAGAVKYLVELMDPAAGMVDMAVAVLATLSTISEGKIAIGNEGGIPLLVEVVELGSVRGKEHAAAALLQLCSSNRFCSMVLQEGAVPPLVALSQSGTARAKEKALALLNIFRSHRHGNSVRP